jgi:hypothetical protein
VRVLQILAQPSRAHKQVAALHSITIAAAACPLAMWSAGRPKRVSQAMVRHQTRYVTSNWQLHAVERRMLSDDHGGSTHRCRIRSLQTSALCRYEQQQQSCNCCQHHSGGCQVPAARRRVAGTFSFNIQYMMPVTSCDSLTVVSQCRRSTGNDWAIRHRSAHAQIIDIGG